jgi:hypothetical protein
MLLSRSFEIKTCDVRSKVIEKLQTVVDTKSRQTKRNIYKGEFTEQGFVILSKTTTARFYSDFWIYGKFENGESGTNILIDMRLHKILQVVFWFFNAVLCMKLVTSLIKSSEDWGLFLGFLIFLWVFFMVAVWFNVRSFKLTLEKLFSEDGGA